MLLMQIFYSFSHEFVLNCFAFKSLVFNTSHKRLHCGKSVKLFFLQPLVSLFSLSSKQQFLYVYMPTPGFVEVPPFYVGFNSIISFSKALYNLFRIKVVDPLFITKLLFFPNRQIELQIMCWETFSWFASCLADNTCTQSYIKVCSYD